MDKELLRQRKEFIQHASRTVTIQKRPASTEMGHSTYNANEARKKKKSASAHSSVKRIGIHEIVDFKASSFHTNVSNFLIIAKIVEYMKKRHLSNQSWGLSLKEILDEIQIFDLSKRTEAWLQEALPKNPKLGVDTEGKFFFKPPLKIKGRSSLVSVLTKYHQEARGGILLSEIDECIPNAEKILEACQNEIFIVNTNSNKRKVVFWNDRGYDIPELDEEYKQIWRSIGIDNMDEKKIEEYLEKNDIEAMKNLAPKKVTTAVLKRKAPKRTNGKFHNDHLNDVLKDFE